MEGESPPTAPGMHSIYQSQGEWFHAQRNRLLRRADIARRSSVLDLGTGTGEILHDLSRRCGGRVIALDRDNEALKLADGQRVIADAASLPFPSASFDLVFTQMFFLWAKPLEIILAEIGRVLEPGGSLIVAAEPDYGGLIEHPPGCCSMAAYVSGLESEGADIHIARKLGAALAESGFEVEAGNHSGDPLASGDSLGFLTVPYFWFFASLGIQTRIPPCVSPDGVLTHPSI